jgi:hypothetical protein
MKSPCTAFITFTNDEAYELANDHLFKTTQAGFPNEKYEKFSLFGSEPVFYDAPEPTNIIWEHLDVTPKVRSFNTRKSVAIIFLVLMGTFVFFTILKTKSGENKVKYSGPAGQCTIIGETMKENKEYFHLAKMDKAPTEKKEGLGYYKCFCDKIKKEKTKNLEYTELC